MNEKTEQINDREVTVSSLEIYQTNNTKEIAIQKTKWHALTIMTGMAGTTVYLVIRLLFG